MKHKRIRKILISTSIFCFAFANASSFAHAVDPVSTATMANALAQAITAYGASQGVSMTFDVASTDSIGEGVHDLWNQFKEDINDNNVPTYDSFAVTVWSTLFSKVNNHVAINLSDTSVSYIDAFWNWLLTGPAEMTKVDNQYYEFSSDQIGANAVPISVYSWSNVPTIPLLTSYGANAATFNSSINKYVAYSTQYNVFNSTANSTVYMFHTDYGNNYTQIYTISASYFEAQQISKNQYGSYVLRSSGTSASLDNNYGYYFATIGNLSNSDIESINSPYYASISDAITAIYGGSTTSNIGVMQYIGDTTPQDVYIPDNEDVNYAPLPYIGELDFPWTDSLYGDGTGTLSDAQSEAITGDLADVIEQDTTLSIAESQDDVIANEVYIPFLPVTLPSFNFSFSGIWHYVVTWVGTLGSWFTTLFTIWSCLPYAMVVPVYATLVVVIVLGVYRRFLA